MRDATATDVVETLSIHAQPRLLTLNIEQSTGIPRADGVTLIPLYLDRQNGVWVMYGRFQPGATLPTHFHTGVVHFFTTRGRWHYAEHPEDPQTAGSYLFEPGGSAHTFTVPADATEAAEGFFVVHGANLNLIDGDIPSITDAGTLEDQVRAQAQQGNPMRYISGCTARVIAPDAVSATASPAVRIDGEPLASR